MEKFKPFRPDIGIHAGNAGHVSTRPVEGGDQAVFDRVVANGEDDRYRSRRRLGGAGHGIAAHCSDHRHFAADEIGRQFREVVAFVASPAEFDGDVLTFDEARLAQALAERSHEIRGWLGV